MSTVSVSTRKPISLGAWLYIAAAVIGAWPVADGFVRMITRLTQEDLSAMGFHGDFLLLVEQWDWVLQSLLEPIVLIAGVAFSFTKFPKLIRALPGFGFVFGFVLAAVTVFAYGATLDLGPGAPGIIWGFLVGDVPHAITYLLAVVLAGAAGFVTFAEKAPTGASSSVAAFAGVAGRTPVGFDPQTGRPIYGYDVNTGQPIFGE